MDAHSAVDGYRAWLDSVEFDADGYITTIIQDRQTRAVLTLGRMDRESLERTLSTGRAWLHSKRQGRLWHRSASGASFRPVAEILESDDGGALIFYVDRISGAETDSVRFRTALMRDDAALEAPLDPPSVVDDLNHAFEITASRLRVLPGGVDHTFRKLRSMLRDAERSMHLDQTKLRDSVAALIARILLLAAARGLAFRELLISVQSQVVAQATAEPSSGLSEECR